MDENLSLEEVYEKEFRTIKKERLDSDDVENFKQFESELMINIRIYEGKKKAR